MANYSNQKYTKELEEMILESIRRGSTIIDACKAAGISRISFFLWRKKDPELDAKVEEALSTRAEIIEDVVFMAAKNGDVRAALEWLKHKHTWRTDINITGKFEHNINDARDADIIAVAKEILKDVA